MCTLQGVAPAFRGPCRFSNNNFSSCSEAERWEAEQQGSGPLPGPTLLVSHFFFRVGTDVNLTL